MKEARKKLEPAGERCAKAEPRVVAAALLVIALLAAAVCALHAENAVALRGAFRVGDCEAIQEGVSRHAVAAGDEPLELKWAEDARFAVCVERLEERGGLLRVSGFLLRLAEPTREVRVRVGLIPGTFDGEKNAGGALLPSDEGILLNTQMSRRGELAEAYGQDDHCGFEAAAKLSALSEGTPYRVVLVEQTDAGMRLFETGCWALYQKDELRWVCEMETRGEGPKDE